MKEIQYNTTELNRMMAFLENQVKKDTEEYKIFSSFIELQKSVFMRNGTIKADRFFL